jgi:hypothetical protein
MLFYKIAWLSSTIQATLQSMKLLYSKNLKDQSLITEQLPRRSKEFLDQLRNAIRLQLFRLVLPHIF